MANKNTLADALNAIKVAEKMGKPNARIKVTSKIIKNVLQIFKDEGYIDDFLETKDQSKNHDEFEVKLNGKINNCAAISPQFSVKIPDWEKYEERYLPAKTIGVIIVTTSGGIVTHKKAKEAKVGGKLLAFVY